MALETLGTANANDLTSEQFRRIVGYVAPEGVNSATGFVVTQSGTPNLTVSIAAGEAMVKGDETTSQGTYYVRNDGAISPANATATTTNPRRDLVVLEVKDASYSGATSVAQVRIVQGTAAASPVDPAIPVSAITLARITWPASTSVITNGMLTDLRPTASSDVSLQVVTNATAVGTVASGATTTLVSTQIARPSGWSEYSGVVSFYGSFSHTSNTSIARLTINRQLNIVTINSGRITIPSADAAAVAVANSDFGLASFTGVTSASYPVDYQVIHTRGTPTVTLDHCQIIATLYRIR